MLDIGGSKGVAKVLVIGDVSTGKTSLIRRYTKGKFDEHYNATIGVEFSLKQFTSDSSKLSIQLWDVAGQERFAGMNRIFYQHAVGAVIVYDVTNPASFQSALKWKKDVNDKVFLPSGEHIPVLLLGNKLDLVEDKKEENKLKYEEVQSEISQSGFFGHAWVSAKTGEAVDESLNTLAQTILLETEKTRKLKQQQQQQSSSSSSSQQQQQREKNVDVSRLPDANDSGGCC